MISSTSSQWSWTALAVFIAILLDLNLNSILVASVVACLNSYFLWMLRRLIWFIILPLAIRFIVHSIIFILILIALDVFWRIIIQLSSFRTTLIIVFSLSRWSVSLVHSSFPYFFNFLINICSWFYYFKPLTFTNFIIIIHLLSLPFTHSKFFYKLVWILWFDFYPLRHFPILK